MHDVLHMWACDWSVTPFAVLDLLQRLGMGVEPTIVAAYEGYSETAVSQRVALAAAKVGILAWRNNVGALQDDTGRLVRYGLCNETKQLNENVKSSDRIGIAPRLITPAMVGTTIGQFWAREVKEYGWKYTGTPREVAQAKFGQIVIAKGGDFAFTTGGI